MWQSYPAGFAPHRRRHRRLVHDDPATLGGGARVLSAAVDRAALRVGARAKHLPKVKHHVCLVFFLLTLAERIHDHRINFVRTEVNKFPPLGRRFTTHGFMR
jgi:hypothetical protein